MSNERDAGRQTDKSVPGQAGSGQDAAGGIDEPTGAGLVLQLRIMARALLGSPVRTVLFVLWGVLVVVIGATAYGQIRLNRWNQPFYDALAHHQFREFLVQLGVFGVIAGSLLILNVAQQWLSQMLSLKLREGLVDDLVDNWLAPRRAFRLASAGPIGVNPDQRMHEDARHLTELSASLAVGLVQAAILVAVFIRVLWGLSSDFAFSFHGHKLAVPGYMVWAAIIYAGSASLLSYWVGHGLVRRNAQRYAREADLRFSLVRVNEHIDAIALAGGEADEKRRIQRDLGAVLAATRRLVTGLTNLTWVTAGYGWFTLVAPIIAASPLYFTGSLSFGGLMMAAGAFTQVQSSLRWFVDNFSTIADWRATLLRVANFRRAVLQTDTLHSVEQRIDFSEGTVDRLLLEELEIASPSGCTHFEDSSVEIRSGERVLIAGESGAGKTLLFRTLAGLWLWGSGRIVRPRGEKMLYIPRNPYLPPATLRELLVAPGDSAKFDVDVLTQALTHAGLERLAPELDTSTRWDTRLSEDEQRSLAVARVLVHAPRWLIIDELLDSLGQAAYDKLMHTLVTLLPHTAILYIGRREQDGEHFTRVLRLVSDPEARRLQRQPHAVAA
ncbi:MAG TPA: ABC transporter ATP-binding protein/permease [Steroidobacteraceae bacterium]|jgi:putative ATP-binding cassette transporter|nr:ABC transporter ATP-binding protein/permease [Steroidobacteraceae bacterium]